MSGWDRPSNEILYVDEGGLELTRSYMLKIVKKGDLNNDGTVDLFDAILAIQVMAGFSPNGINLTTDVNGDRKIGHAEAVYALEIISGMRSDKEPTLIDNDDGTITQVKNDGTRLMWLEDANYAKTSGYDADGRMTWDEAVAWINHLNNIKHLGYSDWRLPRALPVNGIDYDLNVSSDGSTDSGYNITSPNSEMSYMYYVELGNLGYTSLNGTFPQPDWGLNSTSFFTNLMNTGYTPGDPRGDAAAYWSGTTDLTSVDQNSAFDFRFKYGDQSIHNKSFENYAWAVRDDLNIDKGLAAHYPFNGNANDESGNENHGAVYGATLAEDRFGNRDSAYSFDGVDDYIEIPHAESLNMRDQISISYWVKLETSAPYYYPYHIIEKYGSWGIGQREWQMVGGIEGYAVFSEDNLESEIYYNFVLTFDGSILKLYKNGVLEDTHNYVGEIPLTDSNIMISNYEPRPDLDYHFDGIIDDIRIYNRALPEAEIASLYNHGMSEYDDFSMDSTGNYNIDYYPLQGSTGGTSQLNYDTENSRVILYANGGYGWSLMTPKDATPIPTTSDFEFSVDCEVLNEYMCVLYLGDSSSSGPAISFILDTYADAIYMRQMMEDGTWSWASSEPGVPYSGNSVTLSVRRQDGLYEFSVNGELFWSSTLDFLDEVYYGIQHRITSGPSGLTARTAVDNWEFHAW